MNYKLIENSKNDINHVEETVFYNRGIKNYKKYINSTNKDLYDFNLLKNIDKAVECLEHHINNNSHIHIIVDSDVDGYTSSAILYHYLKRYDNNLNITYSLHTQKQHGISDEIDIPKDVQLIIIPDAGTNDVEQCKQLKKQGKDIIILDHHISDIENNYAIIVNNQICDYPNKQLSGVGVTYKFLQGLDDVLWVDFANDYLDLVALGNIADNMDVREIETKHLINLGLHNIKNKMFKALCDYKAYSMGNTITPIGIQFYVVPLINGMIRAGDYDEKQLLFQGFIEQDQIFQYKKRGAKEFTNETIYERVVRLCVNNKNKQQRAEKKSINLIYEDIEKHHLDKNKIIFGNVTKLLPQELTGLTAIHVANHYGKPCILLRKNQQKQNVYGGSGRNISHSPIRNLKDFLESLNIFNYVQGHQSAFGVEINKNNVAKAIKLINEKLKNVDMTKCYLVDFIVDNEDLSVSLIQDIDKIKKYFGTGFEEPYIVIKNIVLDKEQTTILGKNNNTWKSIINDEIALVKFQCKEDDKILQWKNDDFYTDMVIDVVGTASINAYKNILTPQIIVADYEIKIGE